MMSEPTDAAKVIAKLMDVKLEIHKFRAQQKGTLDQTFRGGLAICHISAAAANFDLAYGGLDEVEATAASAAAAFEDGYKPVTNGA